MHAFSIELFITIIKAYTPTVTVFSLTFGIQRSMFSYFQNDTIGCYQTIVITNCKMQRLNVTKYANNFETVSHTIRD